MASISVRVIYYRVRTGSGKPGKSLNLKIKIQALSPGILLKVLVSPEILNSEKRNCKNGIS